VTWESRLVGKLRIWIASNGHLSCQFRQCTNAVPTHFFTQIPHPMHSSSEMNAFLSDGLTSIHSLPILTTGHDRLHSCRLSLAARSRTKSFFAPFLRFALIISAYPRADK